MTTLAADMLQDDPIKYCQPSANKVHNQLQEWTASFIQSRLKSPLPGSDLRRRADQCAERYIFDQDAPELTRGLVESKAIDYKLVWESLRLPATNVWIEYPSHSESESGLQRIGLMVGSVMNHESVMASSLTLLAIAARNETRSKVLGLVSLPETRLTHGLSTIHLHWFLDHVAGGEDNLDAHHDVKLFVYDLIDALFLINTPRVCEMKTSSFGPRKQKIRERTGKPLVEYRHVTMKIGVGAPQYKRSETVNETDAEASRRRLHRVVGHFRTYRENREAPRVSFVPQHWRSDAALGILLHERMVKR